MLHYTVFSPGQALALNSKRTNSLSPACALNLCLQACQCFAWLIGPCRFVGRRRISSILARSPRLWAGPSPGRVLCRYDHAEWSILAIASCMNCLIVWSRATQDVATSEHESEFAFQSQWANSPAIACLQLLFVWDDWALRNVHLYTRKNRLPARRIIWVTNLGWLVRYPLQHSLAFICNLSGNEYCTLWLCNADASQDGRDEPSPLIRVDTQPEVHANVGITNRGAKRNTTDTTDSRPNTKLLRTSPGNSMQNGTQTSTDNRVDMQHNNQSIVDDILRATNVTRTTCLRCGTVSSRYVTHAYIGHYLSSHAYVAHFLSPHACIANWLSRHVHIAHCLSRHAMPMKFCVPVWNANDMGKGIYRISRSLVYALHFFYAFSVKCAMVWNQKGWPWKDNHPCMLECPSHPQIHCTHAFKHKCLWQSWNSVKTLSEIFARSKRSAGSVPYSSDHLDDLHDGLVKKYT